MHTHTRDDIRSRSQTGLNFISASIRTNVRKSNSFKLVDSLFLLTLLETKCACAFKCAALIWIFPIHINLMSERRIHHVFPGYKTYSSIWFEFWITFISNFFLWSHWNAFFIVPTQIRWFDWINQASIFMSSTYSVLSFFFDSRLGSWLALDTVGN